MRNISFFLTTAQVSAQTKDVTRRMGWKNLKVGELLSAVVKGQGLGKGGKIERICTIRVKSVRWERLDKMLTNRLYGLDECQREGFPPPHPKSFPSEFVKFFCASHKGCRPDSIVTRIEFEYVDAGAK